VTEDLGDVERVPSGQFVPPVHDGARGPSPGQVGEHLLGARLGDDDLYDAMLRGAAQVPAGADGLLCLPLFAGTRRDPSLRGTLTGISLDNFSPGHFARALIEGMANGLADSYAELRPTAGPRRRRWVPPRTRTPGPVASDEQNAGQSFWR